jgi:hypothetical protein
VPLYDGDVFVAVLGNRLSASNIEGGMPVNIKRGDNLDLLAQGGLVGLSNSVDPFHRGGKAMPLQVEGFFSSEGRIVNILHNCIDKNFQGFIYSKAKIIAVTGTSAESGKTTLIQNLVRGIKNLNAGRSVACVKLCGTGRLRDKLNYLDAGCDIAYDFVDYGLPSTYMITNETRKDFLDYILSKYVMSDYLILEFGGDLVEHGTFETYLYLKDKIACTFLLVNDTMGALYGSNILDELGVKYRISTYKQNPMSLGNRLKRSVILNTDIENMIKFLRRECFYEI